MSKPIYFDVKALGSQLEQVIMQVYRNTKRGKYTDMVQTSKRLKIALFIMTKYSVRIFGVSSLFKQQNKFNGEK